MVDLDYSLPPDIEAAFNDYLSSLEPAPGFAALLEQELRHRHTELSAKKHFFSSPFLQWRRGKIVELVRTQPLLALIITLIILALLTGAAYAFGKLAGYIPGFGFTSDAQSVYLLSEPVEASGEDLVLSVEQAVSDKTRFWVKISIKGMINQQDFFQAFVSLPDGEKLPFQTGDTETIEAENTILIYLFPPLPDATDRLDLLIEGLGGQNFLIPLKLRPAKPDEILPSAPEPPTPLRSETHNGISMVLDHIAPSNEGTIFQASLQFDQPGMFILGDWNVSLTDQHGSIYPAIDISSNTENGNTKIFRTAPFTGNEQLTVSLNVFPYSDELPVYLDFSTDDANRFVFDPGPEPVLGQVWPLDNSIDVGGYMLRAVSARLASPDQLLFEFESPSNVTGVMLYTPDPLLLGGSGGVPQADGKISAGMTFKSIPSQAFEVRITGVYYTAHGDWVIQWRPPAAPQTSEIPATATAFPIQAPGATPTLSSSDPILLEVQNLAQKFDEPFQTGPAWIYIKIEREINPRPGQDFPPPYILSEEWIETDAEGYVIRSVHIDKDIQGNVIQLSATVGDYSVNFTTGDADFNGGQPYRFSADRLSRDLDQAIQQAGLIARNETTCDDGQACIMITSIEPFTQPVLLGGETQSFSGAGVRVLINLSTGQQVQYQSFWLLEDGTEKITSTDQYLIVEKIDQVPQEIMDILSKVALP